MEGININLKGIDTALAGRGGNSKAPEDFSKILNIILGEKLEESIDLNSNIDTEETSEETLAYLIDSSGINLNDLKNQINVDLKLEPEGQIKDLENNSGKIINLETKDFTAKEIKGLLGKVNIEGSKIEEFLNTKEDFNQDNSKLEDNKWETSIKNLVKDNLIKTENEISGKSKDLNLKSSFQKDNLDSSIKRILNLDNTKEDSLNLNLKDISKELGKEVSKTEDTEIKPFNLEDMQNSLRRIETKDIIPKDIKTPKISDENMDILKDSIVKLIEIKDQGETKTMNVKLIPRELGSIDISLKMEEGKLVAKLLFENDQARQMFSNNMKDLNQSLQRQDISIEEIQIDLGSSNDRGSNGENSNQQIPFKNRNIKFEEIDTNEKVATTESQTIDSGVSILV